MTDMKEIFNGKIDLVSVASKALDTQKFVKIYTPYGYSKKSKYPVLYMFHGGGGDHHSWMPRLGLNLRLDQLIQERAINPLIIVAPQMGQGYAGGGNEEFLSSELIQYVDSNYSTEPSRECRYIGGISMGGFIALHLSFTHPELFSKVGGHSPYLYSEAGVNDAVENPLITAKSMDLTYLKGKR